MRRPGRARRIRQRPEEALHMAVARFLDVALPINSTWLHVPNGGARTKAEAGKFKAMGVVPGVADCLIVYNARAYAIELKAVNGRLSVAQDCWRIAFKQAGGMWLEARSLEEVEQCLRHWGIPLRATLQPGGGWRKAA